MTKETKGKWETAKASPFHEKCNRACNNSENKSDQKIYEYMAQMSGNDECPSGNFGDSL